MLHDPCCNTLDVIMNDFMMFWGFDHWLPHSLTHSQTDNASCKVTIATENVGIYPLYTVYFQWLWWQILQKCFNPHLPATWTHFWHLAWFLCLIVQRWSYHRVSQKTSLKWLTVAVPLLETSGRLKLKIMNSGFGPTTRKIDSWVKNQKHQIVNSGFGLTIYWEQSEKKLILKSV